MEKLSFTPLDMSYTAFDLSLLPAIALKNPRAMEQVGAKAVGNLLAEGLREYPTIWLKS